MQNNQTLDKPVERARVLVTGGAGYVGSHICKALANRGYSPVTLDDLSQGHRWAVQWGRLYEGKIDDEALLEQILRDEQPVGVVHCAGSTTVAESVSNPLLHYENNVSATIALVDRCLKSGVKNFIFSSSCAIYGDARELPLREEHPKNPTSPYGRTKWMIEQLLEDLQRCGRLNYAALRYFNAAGADPEGCIGEDHSPETHLIPLILEACTGGIEQLQLYGTDYPTPDGTAVRDYVHVMDLATAHVDALEALQSTGGRIALNLGTGRGYSVKEVIAATEKVTGIEVPVALCDRRPGDPPQLFADPSRAKKELGWNPQLSSLEQLISTAWQWHCSRVKV